MRDWWNRLSARERWFLGGGGIVLAVALIYVVAWRPWRINVARLQQQVAAQRADLAWMRSAAQEIKRLEVAAVTQGPDRNRERSLSTLIDQTAKAAGLGTALKRVEPQGDAGLRVRLEQVSFDRMLLWLSELEREYGIEIDNAVIDRQVEDGRVNARLVLQEIAS